MRRLVEEYGITLLYIITGIICIVLFSAVFFGDQSSISSVINSSIDSATDKELSIEYTINYDLNGGNFTPGTTVPYTYTKEDRVYLPIPKKDGWLFAGWTGSRLTEAKINVVIPEGSTGNRSYTATWTKGYYRIVYNNNLSQYLNTYKESINESLITSWMSGSTSSQIVEKDTTSVSISASGYNFAGHEFVSWNTSADGKGSTYKAGTSVTTSLNPDTSVSWSVKNITLYAQWNLIEYKISYEATNSSGKGDWTAVRCSVEEKGVNASGEVITASSTNKTAVKTVCLDDKGNDAWTTKDENNKTIELPTKYRIIDTIQINKVQANGYTTTGWYFRNPYLDSDEVENRETYRLGLVEFSNSEKKITINGASYVNALFTDKTSETKVDYILPGTIGNLTLYPLWKGEEYVVTFDLNEKLLTDEDNQSSLMYVNDEVKNYTKIVTFNETYGVLKEAWLSKDETQPEKAYRYKFMGWSLDPACTLIEDEVYELYEKVTKNTIVSTPGNHTLYACWKPISYTIRLHSNY